MYRIIFVLLFMLQVVGSATAQFFPAENSNVNYTLVGFSFPGEQAISDYSVEVAIGNYTNDETFRKNISQIVPAPSSRVVAEVPFWGKEYTWRTSYTRKGKATFSKLHHFSTTISHEVDSTITRLTVLKNAEKYKDAYVFADGANALYNMNGKPVWYLPLKGKLDPKKNKIMDLKLTPQGTITFLLGQNIYEVNYSGDILWEGPDNGKTTRDSNAHYHHEFTRLHNGHYMVLGNDFIKMGETVHNGKKTDSIAAFGTVIEYDEKGRVAWSWKSVDLFKTMPQQYLVSDLYDPRAPQGTDDVHENAFYFDEAGKVIYVSFKNIGSILKVKYPEGSVITAYGKLSGFTGKSTAKLFCGQHSCKTTADGTLYLFNNNTCNKGALPQIIFFQQPAGKRDTLKMTWQYTCGFEDVIAHKQEEARASNGDTNFPTAEFLASYGVFSKGGNLLSLLDGSVFASICGPYGKMFIISPDKKILWSALLESWNPNSRKWEDLISYKANIVTDHADIDRLIWNSLPK